MITEFSYEIKVVDKENNCVTVLFKKEGFPDYLCSLPTPDPEKDLYEVLREYAPLSLWGESNAGTVPAIEVALEAPPAVGSEPVAVETAIIKITGIVR